jgi:hypothetical protein
MTEQACGRLAMPDGGGGVIRSRRKSGDDSSPLQQMALRQANPRAKSDPTETRPALVS